MCKVLVKPEKSNARFYVYNYLYNRKNSEFKLEDVIDVLNKNQFEMKKNEVKDLIYDMIRDGLVTDRLNHYTLEYRRFSS